MKKLWVIAPATVILAIGATTAGVLAGTVSADKGSIIMDYTSSTKDSGQITEKPSTSAVSSQVNVQNYFIDSNNDNICDNYGSGVYPSNGTGSGYHCGNGGYVDDNNDGICDNYGSGVCPSNGTGSGYHRGNGGYVDDNNDGICDNYDSGVCPSNGTGSGYHHGNGGYADDNNDGICDNYDNGVCPSNGTGSGNGHHHGNSRHH